MSEHEDEVFRESLNNLNKIFRREKESRMYTGLPLYNIDKLNNDDLEKVQKVTGDVKSIEISEGRVYKLRVDHGFVIGFDIEKKKVRE